ncbi:unnamed protein product [Timema podura]|uniref:Uncharacterized protein n=1 Tax=Timema podura TaxID=61482 RepID=A0ABN7PK84_TIMPD|nr:unnamed protein product [Timema podura]
MSQYYRLLTSLQMSWRHP